MTAPALFLDRDGTLVDDPGFLRNPDQVALIPGVVPALRRFIAAGYRPIVVTNQSGIARGIIRPDQYEAVARRIEELLAREDVALAATYMCPHHPELTGPCDCRKPGLGHYRRAAAEHRVVLERSLWVGDRPTDLEPARHLGGRGFLVLTGGGREHAAAARAQGFEVAADLPAVADRVLGPQ